MASDSARKRSQPQEQSDDETENTAKRIALTKQESEAVTRGEPPTLLTLPREIRDKIWAQTCNYYDYDNCGCRVDITCIRRFPNMPTAAAACRQMMAEVLNVFLYDTAFIIWIGDCEGERDVRAKTAYMRLCKLQREVAPRAPLYSFSGRICFDNVVKWAKSIYKSDLDLEYDADGCEGALKVLFEMLQTAVSLRGVPWPDVKEVLCSMCRIAAMDRNEWAGGESSDLSSEYTVFDLESECSYGQADVEGSEEGDQ